MVCRVGQDGAWRPVGDDRARVQDDQAVRDVGEQPHVVRHAHDRRAAVAQVGDEARDHRARPPVLPGRGLVEDEDRRPHRHHGRDRDQLPRAALQVVRVAIEDARQAETGGGVRDPRRDLRLADAQVPRPERELRRDRRREQLVTRVLER